jgi:hypothetical protein
MPGNKGAAKNMNAIKAMPLNKQLQAKSIPASRLSRRSFLEAGTYGAMCMAVHNTTEQFAVCQRLVQAAQHGCIHVVVEIWDKFGTTMGQIYSQLA